MPLGFGLLATLPFGVSRGSRLGFQSLHRRFDRRQAVLPPPQFLGPLIPTPRTQDRILFRIDVPGLLEQLIDLGPQPGDFLGHVARTHRLVPRGIALDLGPVDGDRAQADQAGRLRQAEDLYEHVGEGIEVVLAEQAKGAKIGPLLPDDGQERQVALTGPGDLSAGEDPDTRGREEPTNHHGRIEGRGTAGLVVVGGMDLGEIELGDNIAQEEDQVLLRELGGGCVGLVGVKFGCPGTIGFGTRRVHDRSRVWMEQDQTSSSPLR